MSKKKKLKAELILEVTQLQQKVAELETANAEQKQALETLQDSERRFKTIFTDAAIESALICKVLAWAWPSSGNSWACSAARSRLRAHLTRAAHLKSGYPTILQKNERVALGES